MTLAEHIDRTYVPSYSPWGDIYQVPPPANDNNRRAPARPLMIGLTGKRNVGKSTVAAMLEEEAGFERVHAFESGKEAALAWLTRVTGDQITAEEMVYGKLKDVPSHYLPGEVSPRYFLERFGEFMGRQLGTEWTLGLEIDMARRRSPRAPIVVESLVYESAWFKAQGGVVVRLERPGHEGPAGIESDAVQAAIVADYSIAARSVEVLKDEARAMVQQIMGGW